MIHFQEWKQGIKLLLLNISQVVHLVDENLFGKGFKGSVIIGATGFVNYEFVKEVSNSNSVNRLVVKTT